jgi:hypothetical protein
MYSHLDGQACGIKKYKKQMDKRKERLTERWTDKQNEGLRGKKGKTASRTNKW